MHFYTELHEIHINYFDICLLGIHIYFQLIGISVRKMRQFDSGFIEFSRHICCSWIAWKILHKLKPWRAKSTAFVELNSVDTLWWKKSRHQWPNKQHRKPCNGLKKGEFNVHRQHLTHACAQKMIIDTLERREKK